MNVSGKYGTSGAPKVTTWNTMILQGNPTDGRAPHALHANQDAELTRLLYHTEEDGIETVSDPNFVWQMLPAGC